MQLPSTPANPAALERELDGLRFELSDAGLAVYGLPRGPLALTVGETLGLLTFLRSPGAARLIARAWLAEQHAAVISQEA
jgi:hypothetical protein